MNGARAHDPDTGIAVEVGPAGALRGLTLDSRSLRLGRDGLARAVLELVETATARADRRARFALRLAEEEVAALGLVVAEPEAVEETTPTTWRV